MTRTAVSTMRRRTLRLDPTGRPGAKPTIDLVPGPHPYLWVGDEDGCFGTIELGPAMLFLRALVDAYATLETENDSA